MKILKIKDNVNLKELKKYNFIEYKDSYIRHYHNGYMKTLVDKKTRKVVQVNHEYNFYENNKYKINDLIEANLIEESEE